MRALAVILSVAVLAAAGAVVADAATKSVSWKIGTSKTVKIRKGDSVRWVWGDTLPHSVKGPGVDTAIVDDQGHRFSRRFRKRGTFRFKCEVHPTTMKTTVKVG